MANFTKETFTKRMFSLETFPLEKKRVLVRVDFNLPLKGKKIADSSKIEATLPTLNFLFKKECVVILATHLGQPQGKVVEAWRTDILARELQNFLPHHKVWKLYDCIGKGVRDCLQQNSSPRNLFLLENLRFYREEEENDPLFAQALGSLAEVYVNDAFAVSHRRHASIDAITQFLPGVAGLLLQKEIRFLSKALQPERPAIWIMGGAKLDKLDLVSRALQKADQILLGGALPFAFLKAQGIPIGMSKTDSSSVEQAGRILKSNPSKKIIFPVDYAVTDKISPRAKKWIRSYNYIKTNEIALDLGPKTIATYKTILQGAKTIFWNGPLGYFEYAQFSHATREIGNFVGTLKATSICGGGETAEALHKLHLEYKVTHLSTGGGAALEFLSGKKLPGLTALERNYKQWRRKIKPSLIRPA